MGLVWGQGYGGAHIGLYEVDLLVWDANLGGGARQRRDDAERDRRVEPDGVADGDRPIADLEVAGHSAAILVTMHDSTGGRSEPKNGGVTG